MKIKNIYFLLLLLISVVMACHKDKSLLPKTPNNENVNCTDFPDLWISWFEEYKTQFKSPCFNPLNKNEIIYYYKDYQLNIYQLIKYSLITHKKTVLVDNIKIYGQPKWSRKGWVAFTTQGTYVEHIYIIKDNGDSLKKITFNKSNLDPFWDDTGNNLFWTHSPDLGSEWYILKNDIASTKIDTVANFGGRHGCLLNNKIIVKKNYNNSPFYGYYNAVNQFFSSDNFTPIISFPGATSGICWNSNGVSFFTTHSNGDGRGLYEISLNGEVRQLIDHCDSKRYAIIDCSEDGKYLIGERIDSHLELDNNSNPTGVIIESSSIYLINLQTFEETKIDLKH